MRRQELEIQQSDRRRRSYERLLRPELERLPDGTHAVLLRRDQPGVRRTCADPGVGAEVQILLGDFNAVPGSEEWKRIAAAGFADVWATARPGEDGFTWDQGPGGNTEAEEGPPPARRRIDYIFVRPYAAAASAERPIEILSAERVFDEPTETPEGPANISDHYGVAARLRVES